MVIGTLPLALVDILVDSVVVILEVYLIPILFKYPSNFSLYFSLDVEKDLVPVCKSM
jgi:hypothetical protein